MDTPEVYKIAFSMVHGINRVLAEELLARLDSEEAFFTTPARAMSALLGAKAASVFSEARRGEALERARREWDWIEHAGVKFTYFTDPGYPQRLANCDDAPLLLYTLGDINFNDNIFISVVGTRHATPYGIDFTDRLIDEIARRVDRRVVVVSGLAFGIDITAHRAAMRNGLPTIAVLAHGLNTIYPSRHRDDAVGIVKGRGCLLTEYASSAPVHKGNFIARNRIVAGLCDCLMTVESAEKGGALITSRLASDYGRDVFALPGRVSDRYSRGCNALIASNIATLVESPSALIDSMGWPLRPEKDEQQSLFDMLSPQEQQIVDFLTVQDGSTLNLMSVKLDIPIGRLTSMLVSLELRGHVLKFPGGRYRLA